MDNYNINTKAFEGPLDLLLHLIQKNEVDISNIPIVSITQQYMEYIYSWKDMNLEIATEFILMAAQLLEIKSKMLLPVQENDSDEEIDPREELAQKLFEYKIFKEISAYIAQGQEAYLHTFTKDPMYLQTLVIEPGNMDIDIDSLAKIMRRFIVEKKLLSDKLTNYENLKQDKITIIDKIKEIRDALIDNSMLSFNELLKTQKNIHHCITLFLAVLELTKQNVVTLEQAGNFEDIIIVSLIGEY
jgi:segregation and condensation protein A